MRTYTGPIFLLGLIVLAAAMSLTGCSASFAPSPVTSVAPEPDGASGSRMTGLAHGGQQPIASGHLYLFAVGTGGYGSASTSLLPSGTAYTADTTTQSGNTIYYAMTNTDGTFSISDACTTGTAVYLYAQGGDPGHTGTTNSDIGLLDGLGICPASGHIGDDFPNGININELTTIVTAYALAGYAKDAVDIGSTGTSLALRGLSNAMANIPNIVNLQYGQLYSKTAADGTGVIPVTKINSLADVLASCVNSTTNTSCSTLLADELSSGSTGSAPGDTATAAIYMAKNPANAQTAVFDLATSQSPYQSIDASDADFAIGITYPFSTATASGAASDTSGDVYLTDTANSAIREYSPLGVLSSITKDVSGPDGVAVDGSGNIWVGNGGNNTVSEYSSAGTEVTNSPFNGKNGSTAELDVPIQVALDGSGNLWVSNYSNNAMVELNSSGTYVSSVTGGNLDKPYDFSIDPSGNFWVPNSSGTKSYDEIVSGTPASTTISGCTSTAQTASDSSGNIWFTCKNTSVGHRTSGGTLTTYTGGGVADAWGVAVDGLGNAFLTNDSGSYSRISEFNSSGTAVSGSSGFATTFTTTDMDVVDISGNVWVSGSSKVVQFLGLGAPTSQPTLPSTEGTRP